MKDPRREEMLKAPGGMEAVKLEMLENIRDAANDLLELHKRGATWAVSLADLEDAEDALLSMAVEADPGHLLDEVRRLQIEVMPKNA